jgi:hypothetical protein
MALLAECRETDEVVVPFPKCVEVLACNLSVFADDALPIGDRFGAVAILDGEVVVTDLVARDWVTDVDLETCVFSLVVLEDTAPAGPNGKHKLGSGLLRFYHRLVICFLKDIKAFVGTYEYSNRCDRGLVVIHIINLSNERYTVTRKETYTKRLVQRIFRTSPCSRICNNRLQGSLEVRFQFEFGLVAFSKGFGLYSNRSVGINFYICLKLCIQCDRGRGDTWRPIRVLKACPD